MSESEKGNPTASASEGSNTFDLPRANVNRIAKTRLPEGVTIVNEAKIGLSKAAVIFIMYLTAAAQQEAAKHNRSTLMADDVLSALDALELSNYKEDMVKCLTEYRKTQAVKKATKKQTKKGDGSAE